VKKTAFTLIELIISIVILSILMLFLYKSYAGLNKSNIIFSEEVQKITKGQLLKKTIYLDFASALSKSVSVLNQDRQEDVVFLQTTHSVHKRINPYVAYLVQDNVLYRLESLKPFKEYPLGADSEFVSDKLGEVKSFRVYASKAENQELYLVHIIFSKRDEILLKVNVLNSL